MNNNYLIFGVILTIILLLAYKSKTENFYHYYPPSNCMENVFGKTKCYLPYNLPFYAADYFLPWPLSDY